MNIELMLKEMNKELLNLCHEHHLLQKDSEYTLEIQAADMQGNGLVSMGKAVITVTDSNDHAPTFEKTSVRQLMKLYGLWGF